MDVTVRTEDGNRVTRWVRQSIDFLQASWAELKKVTWPTRDELVKATRMILILSLLLGVFIGLLDLLLQKIFVDGLAVLSR
ncbi:MAG: preprotein translocase subunit SecE [Gemmatimonadales bacterium]